MKTVAMDERAAVARPVFSIIGKWRAEEGQTVQMQGGWLFQVTAIRLGSVVAFVREAQLLGDTFLMSAGTRWGLKHGRHKAPQALYLAAPADKWEEFAAIVRASEAASATLAGKEPRPVLRNRLWTDRKAREVISKETTLPLSLGGVA